MAIVTPISSSQSSPRTAKENSNDPLLKGLNQAIKTIESQAANNLGDTEDNDWSVETTLNTETVKKYQELFAKKASKQPSMAKLSTNQPSIFD